jgi:methyltransferase (TIGR00027 family)
MEHGRRSGTALGAALLRAAHLILDGDPKLLSEELGMLLAGVPNLTALRATMEAFHEEAARVVGEAHAASVLRAVRTAQLVRSRYTEEAVEAAVADGVRQYVLLGAGLDSFAYRRRDLADRLRVFEVDHPATQVWKRERLDALGVALPAHLRFVPMDFERQKLLDALQLGGYRLEERAVFSCLGVSQYLSAEAIYATLTQLATAAPSSVVLVGYLVRAALLDADNHRVRTLLNVLTAGRGEPILTDFVPAELQRQLERLGFTEVTDLGVDSGLAQYTTGRTDGLHHPQTHRLVQAWVGQRNAPR